MSENNSGGLNDRGRDTGANASGGSDTGTSGGKQTNYNGGGGGGTGGLGTPYGITPFNVPRKDQTLQDRQFARDPVTGKAQGTGSSGGGSSVTTSPTTRRPVVAPVIVKPRPKPVSNVLPGLGSPIEEEPVDDGIRYPGIGGTTGAAAEDFENNLDQPGYTGYGPTSSSGGSLPDPPSPMNNPGAVHGPGTAPGPGRGTARARGGLIGDRRGVAIRDQARRIFGNEEGYARGGRMRGYAAGEGGGGHYADAGGTVSGGGIGSTGGGSGGDKNTNFNGGSNGGTGGYGTPYGITPTNVPRKDQTLQDRQYGSVGSGMVGRSGTTGSSGSGSAASSGGGIHSTTTSTAGLKGWTFDPAGGFIYENSNINPAPPTSILNPDPFPRGPGGYTITPGAGGKDQDRVPTGPIGGTGSGRGIPGHADGGQIAAQASRLFGANPGGARPLRWA